MTLYRATAEGQIAMTLEEELEFEASREPQPPTNEEINAIIFAELKAIDMKSIRALREGDAKRITELESKASFLRSQLVK